MPLVKSETTGQESAWGLWHISESEEELSFSALESCPDDIISPSKRREFLAGRALVRTLVELVGEEYTGIRKDEYGKPFLKNHPHEISMSHSSPYVAAQIHRDHAVGIDIEQPKEKLLRVAPRILSASEHADAGSDIVKHCIYWCAKEAMYKIHGKRGLHFADQLNLEAFDLKKSGDLVGYISWNSHRQQANLHYIVKEDYVLVFTKGYVAPSV